MHEVLTHVPGHTVDGGDHVPGLDHPDGVAGHVQGHVRLGRAQRDAKDRDRAALLDGTARVDGGSLEIRKTSRQILLLQRSQNFFFQGYLSTK